MYWNPYGGNPPQQPIVFVPSPSAGGGVPDLNTITNWISGLEQLKKVLKEEKKDNNDKKPQPNIISMMLFMILLSPITGPIMSKFFSMGVNMLPH